MKSFKNSTRTRSGHKFAPASAVGALPTAVVANPGKPPAKTKRGGPSGC